MKLQISDEATEFITQRGGSVLVDFIKPTGWGKVAEVSVGTHTKGRNLAAYRKVRNPNVTVYLSPVLYGMLSRMRIETKGRFVKKLSVQLVGDDNDPVDDQGCSC